MYYDGINEMKGDVFKVRTIIKMVEKSDIKVRNHSSAINAHNYRIEIRLQVNRYYKMYIILR